MELPDLDELTLDGAPTGVRPQTRRARVDAMAAQATLDRIKKQREIQRAERQLLVEGVRLFEHNLSNRLVATLLHHSPPSASVTDDALAGGEVWHRAAADDLNPGGPFYNVLFGMRAHTLYPDNYSEIDDLDAFDAWEQTRLLPRGVICEELTQASNRLEEVVSELPVEPSKGYYVRRYWSEKRIFVIGDIHGSLHSLLDILLDMYETQSAFPSKANGKLADNVGVVFLGDLLDRSPYTLECLYVALRLQRENPENCVLLAGNHESDVDLWERYGTMAEIMGEYGNFCRVAPDGPEEMKSMVFRMQKVTQLLPSSLVATTSLVTPTKRLGIVQFNHGSFEDFAPGTPYYYRFVAFAQFEDPLAPDVMPTYGERDGSPLQWGDVAIAPLSAVEARMAAAGGRPMKSSSEVQTYLNFVGIRLLVRGHSDQANLSLLYREDREPSQELQNESSFRVLPSDPLYKTYGYTYSDPRTDEGSKVKRYNTFLRNGRDFTNREVYDMFTLHVMPADLLVDGADRAVAAAAAYAYAWPAAYPGGTLPTRKSLARFDKTLISKERGTNKDMLSVTVASCPFSKPLPPVEIMTCYLKIG